MSKPADFAAFRALSARLGQDPLRVQGPGGNTSMKVGGTMWIKASGTELADAETREIFVAVDRKAAQAEAAGDGDGSCKDTVLDRENALRPSIETTFHAVLDWPIVAHTHSIATITHSISPEGCAIAAEKLTGLPHTFVPYAKPGLPLTREITARIAPETQVIVLQNHGLICAAETVEATHALIEEVEKRLELPALHRKTEPPIAHPPEGFEWAPESWIAGDTRAANLAASGTYYPDHVVFLGPALPTSDHAGAPPAILIEGVGIALRRDSTSSQKAMLTCLSDVLLRLPREWQAQPIGETAEAELLNWDAEKYRQALAARQ